MSDPRPMNPPKQNRRKPGANRLDPIDWHEFANDAVLNGNMSTLFHRPPTEDPSAYASPEALVEIEKRTRAGLAGPPIASPTRPQPESPADREASPTQGAAPSRDAVPPVDGVAVDVSPIASTPTAGVEPTAGASPTVGTMPAGDPEPGDPVSRLPFRPAEVHGPAVGMEKGKKVKPIRSVYDALTLAGQILYKAMYGPPDGTAARHCAKGYRQLAAETHLDKDTVRDLIADFKSKGMVREIASYNPDTRSSKTYEVLSGQAILDSWREAGFLFVTSGRQRPEFCTAQGRPHLPIYTHSGS